MKDHVKTYSHSICLLMFVILFPFNSVKASHIVGGEMTYNCLGNNQYEILLTIFRDCENGNPNAYFDRPATVGVFSANTGAYLGKESFFLPGDDTLDLSLSNPCYVIPPNVCIHTTTYRKIIFLPFRTGGYHLSYQRCCRNNIIANITNPGTTGATYDVQIKEAALLYCNSSPRFREWPPFYICAGTPINYDNSAFDPNGDSIAYRLCTPYVGASQLTPLPPQPSSPPYFGVTWVFPYGLSDMLGNPADPFRIDPITGFLSGTPSANAINKTFVVGVCAIEYRNGVEIGRTKRDFQYSVGYCAKQVTANFVAVVPACNSSLSLLHINASNPSTNIFKWDFGDNSVPVFATSPIHTYPDTGYYTVMMIAGDGQPCKDTVYRQIHMELDGADVVVPYVTACEGDTVVITATNGLANYNSILTYNWSPAALLLSGQGTSSVTVVANGPVNLNLSVVNDNGCADNDPTGVLIQDVLADFDSLDFSCNASLDVPFTNASTSVSNGFLRDFDGTGTSNAINPTHTFPDSGTYAVTLIAGIGAICQDTVTNNIYIPLDGASILSSSPQEACYGDLVTLSVVNQLANYNSITTVVWSPNNLIISGQGTDSIVVLADTNMTFTVDVVNENGCTDTIEATIDILRINAVFDSIDLVCNKILDVPFNNTSVNLGVTFLWNFAGLGTSALVNPTYVFPDTGYYLVTLIGGVGTVCPDTFTQDVYVPIDGAEIMASDSQVVCRGDTIMLTASNQLPTYNDIVSYDWTPALNIITGQGTDSVDAVASGNIDFIVVGTNDEGCQDTAMAHVNVTFLSPSLSIIANPDSIFLGQSSQLYASNFVEYTYDWLPDTTLSDGSIYNPVATPRATKTYYLTVTNQYCTHDDSITVYIRVPVCENPVVFVPSAFTPDNDGYNDVLMVNGNNINEMTIAIYSRWGQKVFETNDQSVGWDGTYQGKELPPDVYGYYMQCTCDEGGTLFLKGNITLLR
jgi:gliding motility-associated-like protein